MEKIDDADYSASTASFSPSFSTYSGDRLAAIAERVCGDDYKEKEDEEFEFAMASSSGDGGLVFPVFDQNLVSETSTVVKPEDVSPEAVVTPLKDLFLRERNDQSPPSEQTYPSSSDDDDEEDDLDTIPSEIYCPWTPARSPAADMSPSGGCRKSKSTGSSSTSTWSRKRWRIRDLLKRSHSDGKQSLKFLNSSSINSNRDESSSSSSPKNKETVTKKKKEKVSAHEKFYLRNKAMKEEDKRKSYLPYKQDLVGLFSNINRYGKAFPPF